MTSPDTTRTSNPSQVRSPRRSDWWSPQLDEQLLQKLTARRDAPGLILFATWIAVLGGTTLALAWAWSSWWLAPVLVVHGSVISFSYAASHECAHRTAFRSSWLNEIVFYVTSFMFGEEPMIRRYSHGRHHAYTWYPQLDSQMPYRNPVTLRTYVQQTLGLVGMKDMLLQTLKLTGNGIRGTEAATVPISKVTQVKWGARGFVAGYAAILAAAALMQSWFPIVAFFGGRAAGGWVIQLFINSQHMCMNEAVADHRHSTRSLKCWPMTRLLYWNMNFHIEHHLYPGVPFHSLPRLRHLIAAQLPVPSTGVLAANLEILQVIRQQASDPTRTARPSLNTK